MTLDGQYGHVAMTWFIQVKYYLYNGLIKKHLFYQSTDADLYKTHTLSL